MANLTDVISVDGWANIYTILKAAGYDGTPVAKKLTIINEGAVATYLHFTSNGATAPSTAADGVGDISSGGSGTSYTEEDVNLGGAWINTAAAADITFRVQGL